MRGSIVSQDFCHPLGFQSGDKRPICPHSSGDQGSKRVARCRFPAIPPLGYDAKMDMLLLIFWAAAIFGTAFGAFCIWLAVRIVNRREAWAKWTAIAVADFLGLAISGYGIVVNILMTPSSYGPIQRQKYDFYGGLSKIGFGIFTVATFVLIVVHAWKTRRR